jgi:hypothetical protein
MQRGQRSRQRELEESATTCGTAISAAVRASRGCGPIQISIGALNQLTGNQSIRAVWVSAKVVQRTQSIPGCQFVDEAVSVLPARGRPVEVPVGRLNRRGTAAIAVCVYIEGIEHRQVSVRGQPVESAAVAARSRVLSSSIKSPSLASINAPPDPTGQPGVEQNTCNVVSAPVGVIS